MTLTMAPNFSAANSSADFETVSVGGVPLAALSLSGLADLMVADCRARRLNPDLKARTVFDLNGQGLSMRETDRAYRTALDSADVIHADGGFLVALSRLKDGPPIPERSATTDMIWSSAARAEQEGLSFFLLGGEPGLAERAARSLLERHPRLIIAGTMNGFFSESDEDAVVETINRVKPDVLWVGLGKPKEQIVSTRLRDRLHVGWVVTCGGCFNFVTGDYKRAPTWMQRSGLEWLHRLLSRPRSLFMRYLITNPHALYLGLTR